MREVIKRYYELEKETKDMLFFLYMYDELLYELKSHSNIKFRSFTEKEDLMEIIFKCWYSTKLDVTDIVYELLEILSCQDITIRDLKQLDLDELLELINEEKETESEIIDEFEYNGDYCVLCKNKDNFLLVIQNEDENTDALVFNSMKDALYPIIKKYTIDKYLYEGTEKNITTNQKEN